MAIRDDEVETDSLTGLWCAFVRGWRPMLAAYLLFQILGFALLGPLSSLAVRWLVSLSGEAALSDADIARFVLSPKGAAIGLVIASLAVALAVFGYATLLVPARRAWRGGGGNVWSDMSRTMTLFPSLLRLAVRFVIHLLLTALPFAVAIGLVYQFLLGDHDINYYLAEKPPVFRVAAGLAVLLVMMLAFAQIRLVTGWFHALPLAVFRGESPREARRLSALSVAGRRCEIGIATGLWLIGTPVATGLLNWPLSRVGAWLVPMLAGRLGMLAFVLGSLVLAGVLVAFGAGFVSTSLFALQNVRLFARHGLERDADDMPAPLPHHRMGGAKAWLACALAVVAATTWLTHRWLDRLVREERVSIIAHRGASGAAPENTLAAVRLAIEQGTDWVEIDVQETADGEVVVFHDSDFKRVGGRSLRIWDARRSDLRAIDIGSWFDRKFSGERTPTLREVLETCRGRCGVLIELKYYGHDQHLESRVVEVVEQTGMADRVKLMSLKYEGVRKVRALRPEWPVGLLTSVAIGDLTRLELDFLGRNGRTVTPALIRRAHRSGVAVYAWTINDAVEMSAMASRGVDGLITDEPGRARGALAQRAGLNPVERLLLEIASRFGREADLPEQ